MLTFMSMAAAVSGTAKTGDAAEGTEGGTDVDSEAKTTGTVETGDISDGKSLTNNEALLTNVIKSEKAENGNTASTEESNDNLSDDKDSVDATTDVAKVGDNFESEEKYLREKYGIKGNPLLSKVLKRPYMLIVREDSLGRFSSVDVDDNAKEELERLNEESSGISWDEELKETTRNEDNEASEQHIEKEVEKYQELYQELYIEEAKELSSRQRSDYDDVLDEKEDIVSEKTVLKGYSAEKDPYEADEEDCEEKLMPETRAEVEGCVSPSLLFASCRYRWEKSILTQSPRVVFVTLNKKEIEPIELAWNDHNQCYYSLEYKIPVGTYVGNLVIDGVFYPVEDVTIKHYTFEVDIYLRDDIIEDEAEKTGVQRAEEFLKQHGERKDYSFSSDNRYSNSRTKMDEEPTVKPASPVGGEASLTLTSKYEELVRNQMSLTMSTLDNEGDNSYFSHKSDRGDLDGRCSPVGDDGVKQYQDGDGRALKTSDLELESSYRATDDGLRSENFNNVSVLEDEVEKQRSQSPVSRSLNGQKNLSPTHEVVDDVLGNGQNRTPIYSTESPVHSKHSSVHSSARQTPTESGERFRPESVGSTHSANSVSPHVLDDLVRSAVERDVPSPKPQSPLVEARQTSGTRTPTPQEQIGDVLNPSDRHSPIRREYLTRSYTSQGSAGQGSPAGSNHSTAGSASRQSPQRGLISDSLRASQEKLYNTQDLRRANGSDFGSQNSFGSRPQSLTSEQELSQYYENGAEPPRTSPFPGEITGNRASSASNLPALASQSLSAEKRSMTPDNHIRVPVTGPIVKPSLLPSRTPPRTPLSNASSRSVTPVNAADANAQEARLKEQIKELESTVRNLRKLLAAREQEVAELKGQFDEVKDINQKIQGDLDRHRARASPGPQIAEMERKYQAVLEERDQLQFQVQKLQADLKAKEEPSLNRYNPNSPSALQRKIDDLTSQVQDLHEVNESAAEEVKAAENKVRELAEENERLRINQANSTQIRDMEEETRQLKSEIMRLKESQSTYNEATDYRLKIELQQLKEDNRNLRERNYQLHDDNIRMKDELVELRKSLEMVGTTRQTLSDSRRTRSRDVYEKTSSEKKVQLEPLYTSERFESRTDPLLSASLDSKKDTYRQMTRSSYVKDNSYYIQERDTDTGKLSKTEPSRYKSYRSVPDGGSSEKTIPATKYSTQGYVPERPSALGQPKPEQKLDFYTDKAVADTYRVDFKSRDRRRTTSADVEIKTLSGYSNSQDLSKTAPILTDTRGIRRRTVSAQGYELRPPAGLYPEEGDMSDTPTDILVNASPLDRLPSWAQRRQRRGSVGSEGSNSSFSDLDEQITASVRKRSKSADSREILRRMDATAALSRSGGSIPPGKGETTRGRTLSPVPPPSGLRTVVPRPLVTQHNKSALSLSSSHGSLTQGLRPFAPRSAGDLQVNDVIKFSRQGGKLSQGTIKFIGHLPGRGDIYLGVELDKEDGKHDGVFEDIRYFKCKPNKGVFVAYNKVVMAWTA